MKRLTILLTLLAASLVIACGKKELPVPQDARNLFAWKAAKGETFVSVENGTPRNCLSVTADLTGSARHVARYLLEVEPRTADICPGCPFMPEEIVEVTPESIISAGDVTRMTFVYCPRNSTDNYRWRLAAHSTFASVPYQFSKVYDTAASQSRP
ncbi:MAG TPA: hypothetical protein IAB01_02925 [Candidatus Avidesulfovibrio excrementigallinarum]|nr:hypothetical protein [Candidatus Avidesulfovibrio excrementigallinarum]